MDSASHSAKALAEANCPGVQTSPPGASATTSTTSSATANSIANRGNRHRSGSHGLPSRTDSMSAGGETPLQPVAEIADFIRAHGVGHRITMPFHIEAELAQQLRTALARPRRHYRVLVAMGHEQGLPHGLRLQVLARPREIGRAHG